MVTANGRSNDALLASVAEEYGTPTYLYDLTEVTRRVEMLRAAFPGARLQYAVKANASGALLRHVAGLGLGAEALTLGELERAARAGFDPARIILGGPGHTPALARRALELGVTTVSLDGPGALEAWRTAAEGWRDTASSTDAAASTASGAADGSAATRTLSFVVRLNPGFDPHTHEHLATAAATSKFGVAMDAVVSMAEELAAEGSLAGFHVHAGSMLTDPEVARLVTAALEPLYERFPGLSLVDLGGGFAVPDAPLGAFAAEYLAFADRHGVELLLEPGRFVVADAGVLLTRVLHVKEDTLPSGTDVTGTGVTGTDVTGASPGGVLRRHVIADAGMNDLLRPALYSARHPIRLVGDADRPASPAPTDVDGPLCENADRLGVDVELPEVRAGDLLVVAQAGAYGYAMSSNYASSLKPAEAVWDGERHRLAARRERPEDLWRLEELDGTQGTVREVGAGGAASTASAARSPEQPVGPHDEVGDVGSASAAGAADSPERLLDALAAEAFGRGPDGVRSIYRYASDKLRRKLGSEEVFARAFGNDLYAPLLSHDALTVGAPQVIGDSARAELLVEIGGARTKYYVGLVKSKHGDRAGSWTLSGVVRDGVDL